MIKHNMEVYQSNLEPWQVALENTRGRIIKGVRLRRMAPCLVGEQEFCFICRDRVRDVDITQLLKFHRDNGLLANWMVTHLPGLIGKLNMLADQRITALTEKYQGVGCIINGCFFVLSSKVIELIADARTSWQSRPLESLAKSIQLKAFQHPCFWQPIDTLRDKSLSEKLWQSGKAPWKIWQ